MSRQRSGVERKMDPFAKLMVKKEINGEGKKGVRTRRGTMGGGKKHSGKIEDH